jgi:hypothetical protein
MSYSRTNPSSEYRELQAMYREMHEHGEQFLGQLAESTFPGFSLDHHVFRIKDLITRTGAKTLLDYGSGKGQQYEPRIVKDRAGNRWVSVIECWDIDELVCYDPAYEKYSRLPEERFDGAICTDVLEHCPEPDLPWIVDEIFSYATKFVFLNVACYPASKRLPDGRNAHITVKPLEWWRDLIGGVAAHHPGVIWVARIQSQITTAQGSRIIEQKIGG